MFALSTVPFDLDQVLFLLKHSRCFVFGLGFSGFYDSRSRALLLFSCVVLRLSAAERRKKREHVLEMRLVEACS